MQDLEVRQLWAELTNPQSAGFLRHVLGCSRCRDLALPWI